MYLPVTNDYDEYVIGSDGLPGWVGVCVLKGWREA